MDKILGIIFDEGKDHFSGRDSDWWTGDNSVWGKLGFGAVNEPNETSSKEIPPILIAVAAYWFFIK